MKYYVTIYIDPLVECFLDFKNQCYWQREDFTHTFLGLTKGKNPDELDKIDETLKQEYLKNKEWDKIDQKWYETKESNEFNDGFWGFGARITNVVDSIMGSPGKVFNNNQYVLDNNIDKNCYIIKKLRSPQTFKPSNRCTLEISKEQYETLLANIKDDFNTTKEIMPNSQEPINEEFTYKLLENNCVTWIVKKLSDIGIELVNDVVKDPSGLLMTTKAIQHIHSIFLKFQNIDDNLQSVKGAKAFRDWARMLINNSLMQEIYLDEYKKQYNNENLSLEQKEVLYALWNISRVYKVLENLLERLIIKSNTKNPKGDFELIYFDKGDKQVKLLKASNDYEVIIMQDLDLNKKYNNFSASKFYPFIFIPKDEILSRMLYHKYDYGNISQEYQKDRNEFYFNVLAGEKSDKYWSSSYHKMIKNLRKTYAFEKTQETIFAYDKEAVDCEVLRAKNIDLIHSKIYFQGFLLTGSTELPNNPFYFGELDKDNIIKQDIPSYYFSPSDESSGKGRLSIFYKNNELYLLNYSILENSLNIKLECLNKQSLEYKDLISNTLKEQKTLQVGKKQAIAKLHALLENQNLECIHGGKVILKSNKGKSFKDNNIPIILESDLLNSSISGCPNTIASVSVPCTKVVSVKGSLSQKKVNNEYAILQELIPACITDKSFPLKVSFTPTKFKFDHSFDPKEGLGGDDKESGLGYEKPIFYIDYKIDYEQKDFIPIHSMKILDEKLNSNDDGIKEYELEINKAKELDEFLKSQELVKNLLQDYTTKENLYKFIDITLQNHTKFYIFIIPKNIPKVLKKYYKDNEAYQNNKDYGVGKFKIVDKINIYDDKISKSIEIYLAPYEAKRIKIIFNENLYEKLTQTSIFCIR